MTKEELTSSRKRDHLRICCDQAVEHGENGFADIRLVHAALPECDLASIDTRTRFLGHELASPLFIAGMTGGHAETMVVNRRLARAAERYGLGMGVGSQRAALEDSTLEESFAVVREEAPHAFICANLGAVQLRDHGTEWAERAIEMIDADAIAIHLNFLQEAVQPEGDHDARGCCAAIAELTSSIDCPVIAKETGCGISEEIARQLAGAGVRAIDVGGYGGTSWAVVEVLRSPEGPTASLGRQFFDWGIPTATSVLEVCHAGVPVIATGGVRSGLDIAKGIAIGADLCGMALPLLAPAMTGEDTLAEKIGAIHRELAVAMFLSGSRTLADLKNVRTYITGCTREMMHNTRG